MINLDSVSSYLIYVFILLDFEVGLLFFLVLF